MHLKPESDSKRLLLISSSRVYGSGYLDHVAAEIQGFLGRTKRVLFVPYALHDRDAYAKVARERFQQLGYQLSSVHEERDPAAAAEHAEAVFVGGGNTFRLLTSLYRTGLLPVLRQRAEAGGPYIGSSAGTVVACPTLKTTNDMPIVQPPSFEALGLVGFQVNPHYLDPDPGSTHMGETRETRLREFLEENDLVVVGLREPGYLRVENGAVTLKGKAGARIFRRGAEPAEVSPGAVLSS